MIYSITGHITDTLPGAVAIEQGGIAFLVNVPDNSQAFLTIPQDEITLFTHMIVREDDISLYGFTDKASLALFKLLLGVNGVGAKAALAILSVGSAASIKNAIAFEDTDTIQAANGVGKKTAQRVVLELKDKLAKVPELAALTAAAPDLDDRSSDKELKMQAVQALMALGYTKTEAGSALVGIKADTVEDYIALALRNR